MIDIDMKTVLENSIVAVIGGGFTWLFTKTLKNAKDCNVAFRKIRNIESFLKGEQDEPTDTVSFRDDPKIFTGVFNRPRKPKEGKKVRENKSGQEGQK